MLLSKSISFWIVPVILLSPSSPRRATRLTHSIPVVSFRFSYLARDRPICWCAYVFVSQLRSCNRLARVPTTKQAGASESEAQLPFAWRGRATRSGEEDDSGRQGGEGGDGDGAGGAEGWVDTRGLLSKIVDVFLREPMDSLYRFWLASCVEAFLRGGRCVRCARRASQAAVCFYEVVSGLRTSIPSTWLRGEPTRPFNVTLRLPRLCMHMFLQFVGWWSLVVDVGGSGWSSPCVAIGFVAAFVSHTARWRTRMICFFLCEFDAGW